MRDSSTPPRSRLSRPELAAVLLGALVLRGVLIAATAGDPVFETPMLDAEYAVDWARDLQAGNWFGSPEGTAYFRTPLYSWFLAAAFWLPGPDLLTARILQALLGAAACAMLAAVAARRLGRTAGLGTGVLAATSWPLLLFGRELLIESLVLPAGALVLWRLDAALDTGRPRDWLQVGLAIGLAALLRPNFLLVAGAAAVLILARRGPAGRGRRLAAGGALAAGVVLLVGPVTVRNRVVSGEWILLSYQAGINLWIGNNPEADGMSARLPGFSSWRNEDVEARLAREYGHPVGPRAQDAHFRARAMEFFRGEPGAAAALLARKTYYFLQGYEIRNNRDLYSLRQRNGLLALPLPDFGWILPLAGLGLFVHRRRWRELSGWLGYSAAAAAGVIVFFVCARYRLVAWPALLPLAGAGAAALVARGAGGRALAGRVLLLAGLVVAARVDFLDIRNPDPSQPHFQYGNIHARTGDAAAAEREYRRALEIAPGFAEARYHLGALLLEQGRLPEAVPELRAAAAGMPESFRVRRTLAEALEVSGRTEEALAVRRETAALSAGAPDDRMALANALGRAGDYEAAWSLYEDLLRGPLAEDPYLLLNAGQTALARNQSERGEELLRRATRDPRTAKDAWEALARYLLSQHRTRDALPVLSEAILRAPEEASLYGLRALARYASGDVTGAIEDLEHVVRLDPDDASTRRRLESLRAGGSPR